MTVGNQLAQPSWHTHVPEVLEVGTRHVGRRDESKTRITACARPSRTAMAWYTEIAFLGGALNTQS